MYLSPAEYIFSGQTSFYIEKKCPCKLEICQKQEYAFKQYEGNSFFIVKFSLFLVVVNYF